MSQDMENIARPSRRKMLEKGCSLAGNGEIRQHSRPARGTPMKTFLQRFGAVVLGVLSGFDRLVFNGKLRQLYTPDGMNRYCNANLVRYKEFKEHAKGVTQQVLQASLI